MMLTNVSSISTIIESSSERAAENFMVDFVGLNFDLVDKALKFRATSAIQLRAIAGREWHPRCQDSGREVKAQRVIFVRARVFSGRAAERKQIVGSRLCNHRARRQRVRSDSADRHRT